MEEYYNTFYQGNCYQRSCMPEKVSLDFLERIPLDIREELRQKLLSEGSFRRSKVKKKIEEMSHEELSHLSSLEDVWCGCENCA